MAKRLYVGNLAYSITEEDLKTLFAEAGTVTEATVGLSGSMGNARGFGYVEMATDEEAARAVTLLNGREVQGRTINVKEPQEPTTYRRFGRGRQAAR